MLVQQQKVDVLSNNMANASTTGFKRERTVVEEFAPYLWANLRDMTEKRSTLSTESVLGVVGTGVMSVWTPIDFTLGPAQVTHAPTDLMLNGQSFFAIRAEDSEDIQYTRSGSFMVDQEGYLLTVDSTTGRRWHVLNDQQENLQLSSDWDQNVNILGVFGENGPRIGVVSFGDLIGQIENGEQSLIKVGNNRFQINPDFVGEVEPQWLSIDQMGKEAVVQGALESSNVNTVREMVELISASRSYEASQKIIQMTDQTLSQVNEIGKV